MSIKNYAKDFHEAFNLPIEEEPILPEVDQIKLRYSLIREELEELLEALQNGDIVETLDALCDLRVVLDGTVLTCGMQDIYEEALDIVNHSNLSKLNVDGKPVYREDGKVLKGENFIEPDFTELLNRDA